MQTNTAILTLTDEEKDLIFNKEFYPQANALYNFAYSLTHNDADSADLVQECYTKAFRFIDKYEVGTNAKAWLFKILKNAFINNYRKKAKAPTKVDIDDIAGYKEDDNAGALSGYVDLRQEIFQNMMGDEVTAAVNGLPVDYRTVILLCDVEDFTYEEISKIIGAPIGTVRSRLFRARNLLKEKLMAYAESMGFENKRS